MLGHLSRIRSSHPGSAVVSTMIDRFDIVGPKGKHKCIALQVSLASLLHFQATLNPQRLSEELARGAVQQLLFALDFLHTEAHIMHASM